MQGWQEAQRRQAPEALQASEERYRSLDDLEKEPLLARVTLVAMYGADIPATATLRAWQRVLELGDPLADVGLRTARGNQGHDRRKGIGIHHADLRAKRQTDGHAHARTRMNRTSQDERVTRRPRNGSAT